jgi:hypothetical protein
MGIARYSTENYGSLIRIEYAPTWQIASFTQQSQSEITGAGIVFAAGYGWQAIYCSRDTMGHRQTSQKDNQGDKWAQSVVGLIPGDEDQIEAGLQQLPGQRYLVRVTLPSGRIKIVGTLKQPLEVELDSNTQTTVPGTAGTAIQFAAITGNRALVVV